MAQNSTPIVKTPAPPAPADAGALPNLYVDFEKNRERLTGHLARLRRAHGEALLPDCGEKQDLLDHFVQLIFPEGLSQAYYFANTSMKEDNFYITLRPRIDGPRLERAFPPGLVLCVHGNPYPQHAPNPVMMINGIVDVARASARPFEREHAVATYASEANVYPAYRRRHNLLTPEFLTGLPPISLITRQKLQDWNDYLAWKRRMIEANVAGIRYLRVELTRDGLLCFLAVAESEEAFDRFQKCLRMQELMAFGLGYSRNEWAFEYSQEYRGRSVGIGDFRRVERANAVPRDLPDGSMPWEHAFAARLYFELEEDDQNTSERLSDRDDAQSVADAVLSRFPSTGFLALSAVGDLTLVARQSHALKRLEQQSGYAPFLSSFLFDVQAAHQPQQLVEIDEWLSDQLNDDQKMAVRKMVSAPDFCLIQGPPGTGKTITIAEAIYQFALRGMRVLLASQSNLAVDNALERLARTPVIRGVRIGRRDKVDAGLQFTRDNVLPYFYGAVAQSCRERVLAKWEQLEQRIAEQQQWIERGDLLQADITQFQGRLAELRGQRAQIETGRADEEARLDGLREQQREREHLQRFERFLGGERDSELLLPEPVLNVLYDRVVAPMAALKDVSIVLNPHWTVRNGDSEGARSGFARDILERWHALLEDLPHLRADLGRLGQMAGDRILDPQTAAELDRLRREIAQVQEAMVDDESQFERYQTLRRREREIKRQGSGLDRVLYERVLNVTHEGRPAHLAVTHPDTSRSAAFGVLEAAVGRVEQVQGEVESGLAEVRRQVREHLEAPDSEEADDRSLRRLDGELRQAGAQIEETDAQLRDRRQRLQDHMSTGERTDPGNSASVDQYPALREQRQSSLQSDREALDKVRGQREVWEPVLRDWVADLENPDSPAHDEAYLLDTYIASCNVVGVTCNENTRLLEEAGHLNFDVVMIDEVSKASPPELLMPMMRGRTAIWVGDHRQLPPLFREREGSWEDAVNEQEEDTENGATELNRENFHRYRKMVTASLFKQHFEAADAAIKASLWIQYRMHPQIMRVVNHFYEYRLVCGLDDPDGVKPGSDSRSHRVHHLALTGANDQSYVTPERHAVWVDTGRDPDGQPHWEEQSGTSKVNHLEAILIAKTLADIDAECRRLGYGGDRRKPIGIISFYGRQVRCIRQAIQRRQQRHGKFEAIEYDINTVDRFQGKERPIILVSMVRNKPKSRASSGAFVAQFERINVAFSRAQELLIVFGASNMFYKYPVTMPNLDRPGTRTRHVYRAIIDELRREGCFWEPSRVMAADDFRAMLPAKHRPKPRR